MNYDMAFGTYEDAVATVGLRSERRVAATAVSGARIQMFAAMVRDPNPSYWDAAYAERTWGSRTSGDRLVAPPALLMGWLIPTPWGPAGLPPRSSIVIRIPLPGTSFVNASNDVELLAPIWEGDRLSVEEEVVAVSPAKRTRLGVGHFVETLETFDRDGGEIVARNRNTLFRFTPVAHG